MKRTRILTCFQGVPSCLDGSFSGFCSVSPSSMSERHSKNVQSRLPHVCYVEIIYGIPVDTIHRIFTKKQGSAKNPLVVKAVPVIGIGGPYICETSRLPYFLDDRLTSRCEVSLT
jgi:hypothetical protein